MEIVKRFADIDTLIINHKSGATTLYSKGGMDWIGRELIPQMATDEKTNVVVKRNETKITFEEPQPCAIVSHPFGPLLVCSNERIRAFERAEPHRYEGRWL